MDFLISSKKVSECPDCSGLGYVPISAEESSQSGSLTIEIGCKACKGKGKIIKRVDLSLESLKDLLK